MQGRCMLRLGWVVGSFDTASDKSEEHAGLGSHQLPCVACTNSNNRLLRWFGKPVSLMGT